MQGWHGSQREGSGRGLGRDWDGMATQISPPKVCYPIHFKFRSLRVQASGRLATGKNTGIRAAKRLSLNSSTPRDLPGIMKSIMKQRPSQG